MRLLLKNVKIFYFTLYKSGSRKIDRNFQGRIYRLVLYSQDLCITLDTYYMHICLEKDFLPPPPFFFFHVL